MTTLVEQIDQILPQTQCRECTYDGCKPYAEAIVNKGEAINRCPPGGVDTLKAIAELVAQDPSTMLADMEKETRAPSIAHIHEAECIGCTKCIQSCPVDAILGSGKLMHTVITEECTGCGLCVEPCPVDCIDIITIGKPTYQRDTARQRFEARNKRVIRLAEEKREAYKKEKAIKEKQAFIKAAVERAKKKRQ